MIGELNDTSQSSSELERAEQRLAAQCSHVEELLKKGREACGMGLYKESRSSFTDAALALKIAAILCQRLVLVLERLEETGGSES